DGSNSTFSRVFRLGHSIHALPRPIVCGLPLPFFEFSSLMLEYFNWKSCGVILTHADRFKTLFGCLYRIRSLPPSTTSVYFILSLSRWSRSSSFSSDG